MPDRLLLALAALYGLVAVAAGAFATHALTGSLAPRALGHIETAARYQMWHALAILAAVALGPWARPAGWLFALGALLFSGSLYALALGAPRQLAWVTPLGGLAFLAGWAVLALAALRR
jgi:uncharacterized membrane protein YgdD (TMEM256/DUF423 family)